MKPTEYFVSWPNKLHEQTEQTRLGLVLYNRVKTGFMVHNKMTFVKGNCWPILEELVSRKRIDILEKTKKRTEKVSLTLTLKIPAPELYNVIKENFDNAEEVLLQNVMDQIHDNLLREALKKELQNIYQKKKRNNAGSI